MSKLYFGCTIRLKSDWPAARPDTPPPSAALDAFQAEGVDLLSTYFGKDRLQTLIEVKDTVSPSFLMQRLKGRLSYAVKQSNADFPGFSRHFFMRSLGQNTKTVVSEYIQSQVDHSDLVDPLYRNRMKELRFREENEVFSIKTRHQGVYDLFAHVVLVTGGRYRMFSPEARKVYDALCGGVQSISATPLDISMMPDHAHLLVRWPQSISAEDLLEGIKRESGRIMRRNAFWNAGGYVGSVGPYPLKVAMMRNTANGWSRISRVPHSG